MEGSNGVEKWDIQTIGICPVLQMFGFVPHRLDVHVYSKGRYWIENLMLSRFVLCKAYQEAVSALAA
jgi:hypothetical protein